MGFDCYVSLHAQRKMVDLLKIEDLQKMMDLLLTDRHAYHKSVHGFSTSNCQHPLAILGMSRVTLE